MSGREQEVEVKFLLRDLKALETRLREQGATQVAPRVLETNLRFDKPDGSLRTSGQALRLRQDQTARVTYKGPPRNEGGASSRQEIEFEVSDFGAARRLLEALGYVVSVIYEKYRATYRLGDVLVTLDEMPYGSFAEVEYAGEGDPSAAIHAAALKLKLDWAARSDASYVGLFDRLKITRQIPAQNLTFTEMEGIRVSPEDMGLSYAD